MAGEKRAPALKQRHGSIVRHVTRGGTEDEAL